VTTSVPRRWLLATMAGSMLGWPLFGLLADNALVPEGAADIAAHLIGFAAFGALLAALQRWAIRARHTPLWLWVAVYAVAQFLAFGLAFALAGPPFDFVAGVVVLGAAAGFLLRREAREAGDAYRRRLVGKGALAGVAAVVAMLPVFAVAAPINDALGGGLPPFLVILALIGGVVGTILGALLRPAPLTA
jgi:hypothetical protein